MSALAITEPQTSAPAYTCDCGCQQCQGRMRYLERKVDRLEQRDQRWREYHNWVKELDQKPTKEWNQTEKAVLRDLYWTLRLREERGNTMPYKPWIEGRAEKIGISPSTYGKVLKKLDENGGLTRIERPDRENGNKRVLIQPTEVFWRPAELQNSSPRNYDYRERRCAEHPKAAVTEVKTTRRELLERATVERVYVCETCGEELDRTVEILPARVVKSTVQRVERSTVEPALEEDAPNLQLVSCPPSDTVEEQVPEDQPTTCRHMQVYTEERESATADLVPLPPVYETEAEEPAWLEPIPGNFPQELIDLPHHWMWVRPVPRGDGTYGKPPCSPHTGHRGSKTDPTDRGTVYDALSAMSRYGGCLVGIALDGDEEIVIVDIDHCVDPASGEVEPWAQSVVDALPAMRWEYSPSRTGLHGYGRGVKPAGSNCRWKIGEHTLEVYSSGAFVTVTGHLLPGASARMGDCTEELTALHHRLCPPQPPPGGNGHASVPSSVERRSGLVMVRSGSDAQVIEKARSARNGAKFNRLYDAGDLSDYAGNASDADAGLCAMLVYYTQDPGQIDRLVRSSALLRDPERVRKWDTRHYADGRTYGQGTIDYALKLRPR